MSKRKPIVNDIIYELDHEDLASSSDDEKVDPKKPRGNIELGAAITLNDSIEDGDGVEVVDVDSSDDAVTLLSPASKTENGGKTPPKEIVKEDCTIIEETNNKVIVIDNDHDSSKNVSAEDSFTKLNDDTCEDIVVDSPGSAGSNLVIGCANRVPLITVMFKDKRVARGYKQKIKDFMLKLIKLHNDEPLAGSDDETDLELDIWPEDLCIEAEVEEEIVEEEDNLFFIDTDPKFNDGGEVPQYSQATQMLSNEIPRLPTPPPLRRGPTCFNCDGPHQLRECPLPRNMHRINEMRKKINTTRVGRYHVEDEQKYGHLVPGRISGPLRHAMGLRRDELPLYIYRMRMLGYPPGWLEEARISHSGITMFDSTGAAIQDPDEEEGEVCEPGSKDKFDIKKILDFPGFNVPASSRYKEDAHRYNLPPLSDDDSKLNMLQVLAPNAMKAYKRKKLAFFPSELLNSSAPEGHAEMELDDGDDEAAFPSVPPLPDEPPPPPPPHAPPPPPPGSPPPLPPDVEEGKSAVVKEHMEIALEDIPLPPVEVVSSDEGEISSSGRESPSLDDLEEKKRLLLAALEDGTKTKSSATIPESPVKVTEESDTSTEKPEKKLENSIVNSDTNKSTQDNGEVESDTPKTPLSRPGNVKTTSYGTPVMNIASPYEKLPSDVQFSKDICDVINFENLPDSTGKYQKICSLLKKVKSEVDRIHDS